MAYDAALLERCLDGLSVLGVGAIRHKNVFGMRGLLRGRRMFAGVGEDSIIVRLAPGDYAAATRRKGVRPFMPGGQSLGRWVVVEARIVADEPELQDWLAAGLRSLP